MTTGNRNMEVRWRWERISEAVSRFLAGDLWSMIFEE